MHEGRRRTVRARIPVVVSAQDRFAARRRAGVATDEALSRMLSEYIEAVSGESGELNVDILKKLVARRGAPIGNANRVTHGKRRGAIKRLRADVRDYVQVGRDL